MRMLEQKVHIVLIFICSMLCQNFAFFVNPIMHSCLILKMVQMTILYGLSPVSPVGFAAFGGLIAKMENGELLQLGKCVEFILNSFLTSTNTILMMVFKGSWFTMLAKSINAKMGSKEAAGKLNTLTVFNL